MSKGKITLSEVYKDAYLNNLSRWDHTIKVLQERSEAENECLSQDAKRELKFVLRILDDTHRGLTFCPREEEMKKNERYRKAQS